MNYVKQWNRQWHKVREYSSVIHYGWTICGKVIEGGWDTPVNAYVVTNKKQAECKRCFE